jgi:MFS family permease
MLVDVDHRHARVPSPGHSTSGFAPYPRPVTPERKDGLWAPARRGLTIGLVLTITFIASEALAVITVMPVVARDLGGLSLYGWVFSTFMLGSLVGIVVAGRDADRHGPARPYLVGLVLFAAGLVVAGLAPTMAVLVVGRGLQGFGAGAVPAVAYVAIGRSLPETLRPRMMAVLSTAWVVPGIVGPAVAAAVAHLFGWRWVFLGLVPLVAIAGPLALPALVHLGKVETAASTEHRVTDGIRTAAGAALFLAALDTRQLWLGLVLVVAGALVGVPALRRLLPAGTLAARPGLPTTILSRGLLTFAFFGADAYVTLSITTVRHHSTLLAGAVVTSSTLAWTAGSWVQAHFNARWEGRRLVRAGLTCILIGIAGMVIFLHPGVPLPVAFVSWTVSGFGMGLCYAPISLMMLRVAPSGREGWASASLNLADVLGTALGVGVGGAAVAAVSRAAHPVSGGVALAYAAAAAAAVFAVFLSPRLPRTTGAREAAPSP